MARSLAPHGTELQGHHRVAARRQLPDFANGAEFAKMAALSPGPRIEVKGFGGTFKPRYGSMLFTPPQMRHAEHNEAYFVYIVENVKQGDATKVQVRVLHGEQLRKVVTDPGVQIQRYSVPLRRAECDRLPQLEDWAQLPQLLHNCCTRGAHAACATIQ